MQSSNEWHVVFVDDGSLDNSIALAHSFKNTYPHKFTIIANEKRVYKTENFLKALECIPEISIVAELDADDELLSEFVVEDILNLHEDYDLVYTNHKTTNCSQREWHNWRSTCLPSGWSRVYPEREKVWDEFNFPGHLRTFKKHLFAHIDKKDLYYENELIKVAFDMVYYTILLELTPSDKIFFLDKNYYNYIIRNENDQFTEDDLTSQGEKELYKQFCQTEIDKWFKSCKPYSKK